MQVAAVFKYVWLSDNVVGKEMYSCRNQLDMLNLRGVIEMFVSSLIYKKFSKIHTLSANYFSKYLPLQRIHLLRLSVHE